MRFRLVPRDEGFFALFNQAAENAVATAVVVQETLGRLPDVELLAEKALELEQRGDQIARQISQALDNAIVTPFDREDIHAFVDSLDTAVDDLSASVDLMRLHHISEPIERIEEFGELAVQASEATARAIAKLQRLRDLGPDLDEIDELETKGDQLYRQTTALLYSGSFDAFTVLRWKDVIEALEGSLNAFERTADVIARIALKHS